MSADCKPEVALAMLRWAYTDNLELSEDDAFLIDLMKLANRFQLLLLRERSAWHKYRGSSVFNISRFWMACNELVCSVGLEDKLVNWQSKKACSVALFSWFYIDGLFFKQIFTIIITTAKHHSDYVAAKIFFKKSQSSEPYIAVLRLFESWK